MDEQIMIPNMPEAEETKLSVIVKESGLEPTKAQFILDKFTDYFKIADDWTKRAQSIVVTDETQEVEMQLARTGRLFLREKRIAVENSRKELKEQCLREGKAIDGIANVLKSLIVPIEEYLEKQEKFVEFKIESELEQKRLEIEKRMEEERIAKEKAEIEERERIRIENIRLKKEAEEKETALKLEREKVEMEKRATEEKIKIEKEIMEARLCAEKAKADLEKKSIEEKARKEKEQAETLARVAAMKHQAEIMKAEQAKKALEEKTAKEKAELEAMLAAMITCPKCGHKFNKGE